MATKKTKTKKTEEQVIEAVVTDQPITETLKVNYMPYAMSVIISRAIPEIDGFKPAHRKLLYTMYKMGLMTGDRTKSSNVVGSTMRLNPHGDAAIYETMVRLTRGNEALLHPFVDSKGSFGKVYSDTQQDRIRNGRDLYGRIHTQACHGRFRLSLEEDVCRCAFCVRPVVLRTDRFVLIPAVLAVARIPLSDCTGRCCRIPYASCSPNPPTVPRQQIL